MRKANSRERGGREAGENWRGWRKKMEKRKVRG
jgi:hypothetical protein